MSYPVVAGHPDLDHHSSRTLPFYPRLLGSSQRLSPFVKDVEVAAIDEQAVPLAAGGLFKDAEIDHVTQGLRNRWSGYANPLRR